MNKRKIINDPVYGFVSIPSGLIFDLIQHPYMQRLRYIKQVSMTHLVYPGALHTRFQHVIGAMHLMQLAIDTLRGKDVLITKKEEEAALIAILLHDIGHGPFSHSLEHTIIEGVSHEVISSLLMDRLNLEFGGQLDLAITIFNNQYHRPFFHQLVSSQLDVDRMDYLNRDSFFTGVSEGVISFDRILKMLTVQNEELLVEAKGIYSVEKFLIARRLMYWQVYLHKTVISAEQMLIQVLRRAKLLAQQGERLFATPALSHFLENKIDAQNFTTTSIHLDHFTTLDDTDILASVKSWAKHDDKILSLLCNGLMKRQLFRTEMRAEKYTQEEVSAVRDRVMLSGGLSEHEVDYFVYHQSITNSTYSARVEPIKIINNMGQIMDIAEASDLSNIEALSKNVTKYALTYPKSMELLLGLKDN